MPYIQAFTTALQNQLNHSFYPTDALSMIKKGANPNTRNSLGSSLIDIMISGKQKNNKLSESYLAIIKEAVNLGYDINKPNPVTGKTPLSLLLGQEHYTSDAMHLIRLGAHPHSMNGSGYTIIDVIYRYKGDKTLHEREEGYITELVNTFKFNLNKHNAAGYTPLQTLLNLKNGFQPKNAMHLIRLGADPLTINRNGKTLLDLLATSENMSQYEALLAELSAIIRKKDKSKDSKATPIVAITATTPTPAEPNPAYFTLAKAALLSLLRERLAAISKPISRFTLFVNDASYSQRTAEKIDALNIKIRKLEETEFSNNEAKRVDELRQCTHELTTNKSLIARRGNGLTSSVTEDALKAFYAKWFETPANVAAMGRKDDGSDIQEISLRR